MKSEIKEILKEENDTSETKENVAKTDHSDQTEEDEDVDGMRAMRKETASALSNMEAEFEAGRSKLAAIRARIKRAREMAYTQHDD